jgi:hypothetical protein
MPEVPEDKYRTEVSGLPPGFYLKSALAGTQDILKDGLTISNAVSTGPLQLTVSSAGARLDGSLSRDREPIAGVKIEIVNRSATPYASTSLSATTDQRGAFRLEGIPPGTYQIFASENQDIDPPEHVNLNSGRMFMGEVELVEGDRKQFDLRLPQAQ